MIDPPTLSVGEYHRRRRQYLRSLPNVFRVSRLTGPGGGEQRRGCEAMKITNGTCPPMTTREAAERYGVALNTIYNWLQKGTRRRVRESENFNGRRVTATPAVFPDCRRGVF